MKHLVSLLILIPVLISCQKKPPETSSTADTTVSTNSSTPLVTVTPNVEQYPYSLVENGDSVTFILKNKKLLSFAVPKDAKVEVTTGKYGTVVADWEPYEVEGYSGSVTYKSLTFQFNEGYCYYPGDEGTSTEIVDTLEVGPGFAHGVFDNLAAGAYGIQEIYYMILDGYCVRFDWTLGMDASATAEDRKAEVEKLENFIRTVKFE